MKEEYYKESEREDYTFEFLGQTVFIEVSRTGVFIEIGKGAVGEYIKHEDWTVIEYSYGGSPSDPVIPYDKQWLSGAAAQSHRNKQLRKYAEDSILRALHREYEN